MAVNKDQVMLAELVREGVPEGGVDFGASPICERLCARVLALDVAAGTIDLKFKAGEEYVHGWGTVQGGIIVAMLDFAMAMAVLAGLEKGQSIATSNINTEYLRPAPPGDFRATAEIIRKGRRLAFARAELFDANGKHVASATTTNVITGLG